MIIYNKLFEQNEKMYNNKLKTKYSLWSHINYYYSLEKINIILFIISIKYYILYVIIYTIFLLYTNKIFYTWVFDFTILFHKNIYSDDVSVLVGISRFFLFFLITS